MNHPVNKMCNRFLYASSDFIEPSSSAFIAFWREILRLNIQYKYLPLLDNDDDDDDDGGESSVDN